MRISELLKRLAELPQLPDDTPVVLLLSNDWEDWEGSAADLASPDSGRPPRLAILGLADEDEQQPGTASGAGRLTVAALVARLAEQQAQRGDLEVVLRFESGGCGAIGPVAEVRATRSRWTTLDGRTTDVTDICLSGPVEA